MEQQNITEGLEDIPSSGELMPRGTTVASSRTFIGVHDHV